MSGQGVEYCMHKISGSNLKKIFLTTDGTYNKNLLDFS